MSAEHQPREALSYSVPDAGRQVGLSKTTMWRLIASGELKTFKIGGRTLIAREDLEAYRAAQAVTSPEPTCGVYLLALNGVVVYVGRSTTLRTRLRDHRRSGRPHDEARIIACDEATSVWLEKELIRTLRPAQNVLRYQRHAKAATRELRRRGLQ